MIAPFSKACLLICISTLLGSCHAVIAAKVQHSQVTGTVVATAQGKIVGVQLNDRTNGWFGIPYAKPPINSLRWQPPQPLDAREESLQTKSPGSSCVQPAGSWSKNDDPITGSEDCLYLNVYAPISHDAVSNNKYPVMVWIHGGANYMGRGDSVDGAKLAALHNLVVVTINYRLGPFGWFHHPVIVEGISDTDTSAGTRTGNFALLDMLAALIWVKENAEVFGGDADNITVFGESAGAQNIYALLMTPLAKGLFHRAIAESGGFWNMSKEQAINYPTEPVPGSPASARQIVAELLLETGRSPDMESAQIMQTSLVQGALRHWLRSLSAEQIMTPYLTKKNLGYDLPSVTYDGVMFPDKSQTELLIDSHLASVPVLIGSNRDEQKLYQWLDPKLVLIEAAKTSIRDPIKYERINYFYSTWWTVKAVNELADIRLLAGQAPVFAYRFDWDDEYSGPDADYKKLLGAAHGIEIPFVFGDFNHSFMQGMVFNASNREAREKLSDAVMSYWAEFAYTGKPGKGRTGDLPEWHLWNSGPGSNKLILDTLADGGIRMERDTLDADKLYDELFQDTNFTKAEKCRMYKEMTMYPNYDLKGLAARGCSP
ncbi:MAG: carboxylesterase family protein [Gammaproteobacteria bacterium]|nr:carboxylesterase family protein [Gammaproteobacteria bacterium]